MGSDSIVARLREMSRMLASRGWIHKGVDMSPGAVTLRLRTLGGLSDMCRRLVALGPRLRPNR